MPHVFSFGKSKYRIYAILFANRYHGLTAVIPCNIILLLYFVELVSKHFAFLLIFSGAIKFKQSAVSFGTHKLVIILFHETNKFITSFSDPVRKFYYFLYIRTGHIGFSNQNMSVGQFMELF